MTLLLPDTGGESVNHIVRYVNPKGSIEQRIVGNSLSSPVESFEDKDMPYSMHIEFNGNPAVTIDESMTLADDAIWHGASGLAGKLGANKSGVTLWPGPTRIRAQQFVVPADREGSVKITITSEGERITGIHALYPAFTDLEFSTNNRQMTPLQTDFLKKFRRGDPIATAMLPKLHALSGLDESGNAVKLIFNSNQLVDVEYPIGASASPEISSFAFRCDPSDLDHVTGLVMALEDKMASGDLEGPTIQQAFDTLDTHRQLLETGEGEVTPKINAAVQEATTALWQTIDGRARQRRYLDKLTRGGGPNVARKLALGLAERMRKARGAKSRVGKWFAKARKSEIRTELEDLEHAINQVASKQFGLKQDVIDQYNAVITSIIYPALNPAYGAAKDEE